MAFFLEETARNFTIDILCTKIFTAIWSFSRGLGHTSLHCCDIVKQCWWIMADSAYWWMPTPIIEGFLVVQFGDILERQHKLRLSRGSGLFSLPRQKVVMVQLCCKAPIPDYLRSTASCIIPCQKRRRYGQRSWDSSSYPPEPYVRDWIQATGECGRGTMLHNKPTIDGVPGDKGV